VLGKRCLVRISVAARRTSSGHALYYVCAPGTTTSCGALGQFALSQTRSGLGVWVARRPRGSGAWLAKNAPCTGNRPRALRQQTCVRAVAGAPIYSTPTCSPPPPDGGGITECAFNTTARGFRYATRSKAPNGTPRNQHRAGYRSPDFQKFIRLSGSFRQSGGLEYMAAGRCDEVAVASPSYALGASDVPQCQSGP
jgi:hypothetical protein